MTCGGATTFVVTAAGCDVGGGEPGCSVATCELEDAGLYSRRDVLFMN